MPVVSQESPESNAPTCLVMSSFVSASRVGATASAFCLRRLGVETLVLPTVLLGRHPGWGAPGGGPVDIAHLRDVWNGIKAQDIKIDAVMSGYMGSIDHAALMREIISYTKTQNPDAIILVDPVMGDHGRLYIPEPVAQAILTLLVPLADFCTPNLWELGYLTQTSAQNINEIITAAQSLPSDLLVTSVPFEDKIGALLCEKDGKASCVAHQKFESVPHGGGDALAATFLAHLLNGKTPKDSLARAVGSIFDIMSQAAGTDAGEMPLIREQNALCTAAPLTVRDLP